MPTGPGLGVELDRDALARLHEQYLACGITERDDTGYYRGTDAGLRPDGAALVSPLRILQTDTLMAGFLDDPSWETLAGRPDEDVVARLPAVDVLVASHVTPAMARAATRLRLLHLTGAGLDRVPLGAFAPGVTVCNTFHHGRSIAEHVVMVSLMLSRRVLHADRMLRQGVWASVAVDPDVRLGGTLAGRTVGVVGLGEIGQRGGARAHRARHAGQGRAPEPRSCRPDLALDRVDDMTGLDDLLSASDIVVLTVPLTAAHPRA